MVHSFLIASEAPTMETRAKETRETRLDTTTRLEISSCVPPTIATRLLATHLVNLVALVSDEMSLADN